MAATNKQTPFSNYNVSSKKNPVPRTPAKLNGYIANSFNGGHNRTIAWKQVLAGERHKEYKVRMNIKMLTPLTPTYQALKCTLRTYFVPNSRVWENAEAFEAQNPTDDSRPLVVPNLGNRQIPFVGNNNAPTDNTNFVKGVIPITQTLQWRDMFISSYVPRLFDARANEINGLTNDTSQPYFPAMSALPLRGRVAIYNDFERNKEYDTEITEFKGDEVTQNEMMNYLPVNASNAIDTTKWFTGGEAANSSYNSDRNLDYYQMRAKKDDSYYTDYRTNSGGFDTSMAYDELTDRMKNLTSGALQTPYPKYNNALNGMASFTWAQWENLISEARSQAENANLNEWEIISKIRGSKLLTEGKVQLIGQKTFNLNNKAVTQTSNNNAEGVNPMYKSMGTQGAYSYTEVEVPLYSGMEFNESGYIHVIATVSADTVYESGIDATLLNIHWEEQYRPDMANEKTGVLRYLELGTDFAVGDKTVFSTGNALTSMEEQQLKIVGYKRKYNEYFKLPNVIAGDMTTEPWLNAPIQEGSMYHDFLGADKNATISKVETQATFQYFEPSADASNLIILPAISEGMPLATNSETWVGKKIWKDYTDLSINRNQAVLNPEVTTSGTDSTNIYVAGQNQIFFVGVSYCDAILPINWEVKENATEWGEH